MPAQPWREIAIRLISDHENANASTGMEVWVGFIHDPANMLRRLAC
jgi:hypothetical protein